MILALPVSALDLTAPPAPEDAIEFMPKDTESFGEGLWFVIKTAISKLQPNLAQALSVCASLIAVALLSSFMHNLSANSKTVDLVTVIAIGALLIGPAKIFIQLGVSTVTELSEYGKLFLPVITAAFAAQGGVTGAASLYAGTVLFDTLLASAITKFLIPMVNIYLCLCIVNAAVGEQILKDMKSFVKWLMTWTLKIILYVFTGYISITGVISGSADAAAIKAAKLAISGFVPVVGGIISDASESILVGAGMVKNAVGIYGVLAFLAIWIGPFIRLGIQYLLLKAAAAICSMFASKSATGLIRDFSGTLGLLLAMTGTVCLLLLISTVCFMKGVG